MISRTKFQNIIKLIVTQETSICPECWSLENPMLGHCAAVALLAQDFYGGNILKGSLEGTEFSIYHSHYWNIFLDGTEFDFTEAQFQGRKPKLAGEVKERKNLLENKDTYKRYMILKNLFLYSLTKIK